MVSATESAAGVVSRRLGVGRTLTDISNPLATCRGPTGFPFGDSTRLKCECRANQNPPQGKPARLVPRRELRYSAAPMILAARQVYFWYFGNPTLLAPVEDRSA